MNTHHSECLFTLGSWNIFCLFIHCFHSLNASFKEIIYIRIYIQKHGKYCLIEFRVFFSDLFVILQLFEGKVYKNGKFKHNTKHILKPETVAHTHTHILITQNKTIISLLFILPTGTKEQILRMLKGKMEGKKRDEVK